MDRLKALPGVGDLHAEAVACHIAKRDGLLTQDSYRDLRDQLLSAPKYPARETEIIRGTGTGMSRLRIVNLALPKTGTTTLTDALRAAGLTVADWKIRPGQSQRSDILRMHVGKVIYEDYFDSGDPLARLGEFDVINEMSAVREDRSFWPQTDWGLLQAIQGASSGGEIPADHP